VGSEILAIATTRSDRLGAWQQHGSIKATAEHGELPYEMLPVGPMPMARIGEIVRGPAAYEDLRIDDDLVDAIRADTVTPDALPLLAYTLQYLHRHFAEDGHLTLTEYRSFGGLEGSVRSQADAAIPVDGLSEEDRRALREAFVPGLVRATAQGGFSRNRAVLASLSPRAEPHLQRLVDDARLLTTDRDSEGNEREYDRMGRLAEAVSRKDPKDPKNRRLYAQYLIETGKATAAADILRPLAQRLSKDHPEFAEATGLLGRAYKQVFFDAGDKTSPGARAALKQAIATYRKPFEDNPADNTWHGVKPRGAADSGAPARTARGARSRSPGGGRGGRGGP
jgi:hypothetical protein